MKQVALGAVEIMFRINPTLLLSKFVLFFSVWLHQTRIGLSLYDVAGQGYLKESVSPAQ